MDLTEEWYETVNLAKPIPGRLPSVEWEKAYYERLSDTAYFKYIKLESPNIQIEIEDEVDYLIQRNKKYPIMSEYDENKVYTERQLLETPELCDGKVWFLKYYKENENNKKYDSLNELLYAHNNGDYFTWLVERVDLAIKNNEHLVICTNRQYYDVIRVLKAHLGNKFTKYVSGFRRPLEKHLTEKKRKLIFETENDEKAYHTILDEHKLSTLITVATCYIREGIDINVKTEINKNGIEIPVQQITYIINQHVEKWNPGYIIQQMNRTRNARKNVEIVYKNVETDFDCQSFIAEHDTYQQSPATKMNKEMLGNFYNMNMFDKYFRQCSHSTVFEYEVVINENNLTVQKESLLEVFNQIKDIPIISILDDYRYSKSDYFHKTENTIYLPYMNISKLMFLNKDKLLLNKLDVRDDNDVKELIKVFMPIHKIVRLCAKEEHHTVDNLISFFRQNNDEKTLLRCAYVVASVNFDVYKNGKQYDTTIEAKYSGGNFSTIGKIKNAVMARMLDEENQFTQLPEEKEFDTKAVFMLRKLVFDWYNTLKELVESRFFWWDLVEKTNLKLSKTEQDEIVKAINDYLHGDKCSKYYLITDSKKVFKKREDCYNYYIENKLGNKTFNTFIRKGDFKKFFSKL